MGRAQDCIEPLIAVARRQGELAVWQHTVHREPVAVEVVARRVEDEEVDAGDGTGLKVVIAPYLCWIGSFSASGIGT